MFNIPENKLPQPLKDENRLSVLFSPLRNRNVNAKDWTDKISSWKDIIKLYCEENDIYSFTLVSLNHVFLRHNRPPPCLKEVLNNMIENGEIETEKTFISRSGVTWGRWLTDVIVRKPLSWSYNTLRKSLFATAATTEERYVYLEVIKNKSEELFKLVTNHFKYSTNIVISFKDLLKLLDKNTLNAENVKLLIHYLCYQQKIATRILQNPATNDLDTLLIKFGNGHSPVTLTEIDSAIYTLEQHEKSTIENVEKLEDEVDGCIQNAKMYLKKNRKTTAKNCLAKKRIIEKQIERNGKILNNIQTCLEQLKGTHTNTHVWDAYKHALNALNATQKETGLSQDAVDDTIVKLGDILDEQSDIQSALAQPSSLDNDLDLQELEKELEELMVADDLEVSNQNQPSGGSGETRINKSTTDDIGKHDDDQVEDEDDDTEELEKRLSKLLAKLPDVPESEYLKNVKIQSQRFT